MFPDDILSQMEDVKYKKTPPVPPPKPSTSSGGSTGNRVRWDDVVNKSKSTGRISNGHGKGHKLDHCPHKEEYPILSRSDTHPHMPQPHPPNLEEHTTSNTLFPTPAPPLIKPISPAAKRREVIKSPFDPETRSDELKKFGISEANEEEHKFNSYHLDYKYTPPPIKGPCVACGEGIIGPVSNSIILTSIQPTDKIHVK